jgi:hypothetical protein
METVYKEKYPDGFKLIRRQLYNAVEQGHKVSYDRLIKVCGNGLSERELLNLLEEVNEIEYQKHGVFLISVVVKKGHRIPSKNFFMDIVTCKCLPRHTGMRFEKIYEMEHDRLTKFVLELNRPKPTHDLF